MPAVRVLMGQAAVDLAIGLAYESARDRFRLAGRAYGIDYVVDVAAPPVVRLRSDAGDHDLVVEMGSLLVRARRGHLRLGRTLALVARGRLRIAEGEVSAAGWRVASSAAGRVEHAVVGVFATRIGARLAAAVDGVRIPDLARATRAAPRLRLVSGEVVPGPAFAAAFELGGTDGAEPADHPSAADVAAVSEEGREGALVVALVSGGALTALLRNVAPPVTLAFERAWRGAGLRGTIIATAPVLEVSDGTARAATTVTFAGLEGGLRMPIKGWSWLRLPDVRSRVVVTHGLEIVGETVALTLTGVEAITPVLTLPRALAPVAPLLRRLLDAALEAFRRRLTAAYQGRSVEVLSLREVAADLPIPLDVRVDPGGLGYHGRSLRVRVRICRHVGGAFETPPGR
jgi:hypothetical protein